MEPAATDAADYGLSGGYLGGGRFFAGVCEDMVRQRTARFGPYPLMPGGLSDRDGTTRTAGFEEAAAVLYSKRVNLLVFDVLGREFV